MSEFNYDYDFVNNEFYNYLLTERPEWLNHTSTTNRAWKDVREDAKKAIEEAMDALNTIYIAVNQTCTATHKMLQPPCPQGLDSITNSMTKLIRYANPIDQGYWRGMKGDSPRVLPMTVNDLIKLKIHIRKEIAGEIKLVKNLFEREHMPPPKFTLKRGLKSLSSKAKKLRRKFFGREEHNEVNVGPIVLNIALVLLLLLVLIFLFTQITSSAPVPAPLIPAEPVPAPLISVVH